MRYATKLQATGACKAQTKLYPTVNYHSFKYISSRKQENKSAFLLPASQADHKIYSNKSMPKFT